MTDDAAEAVAPEDEETSETADDDDQPTEEESTDEDTVSDEDFVKLAYTARSAESDQLVDTTDAEVAEDEGVDVEGRSFGPRVIALGAGHVFPSVESAIVGSKVGDSETVEVPPSEAFGEYDPEDVRTVSADTIPEDDRYPGAQVEIDGEHGFVETIIGGRARVDFNHPIAGENIEYEYEVLDIVDDRIERASGLLSAIVDVDLDLWIETEEEEQEVEPDDKEDVDEDAEPETELVDVETLYIESVPQLAMNQQWLFRKRQIAQDIIDRIGVDRVIVQETIEGTGGMGMGMPGMGDIEAQLDDVDVDAEEIVEELDEEIEE